MGSSVVAGATVAAAVGLLLNALTWGISWWPFRALQSLGLHPLWSTALMYGLVAVGLLASMPGAWRAFLRPSGLWLLLVSSGLTNVCFNWAVTVGDVVRVVLLFYLMPAWVVLLAWALLDERPAPRSLGRVALAMVGVAVVLKTDGQAWPVPHSLADWLALAGGFCFGLTNVLLRRLRGTSTASTMLAMFAGGATMAALVAWWGGWSGVVPPVPALAWDWVLGIVALGVVFMVGNLGLQYGAARFSAGTTSIVMLSEVVFASVSAVALGAGVLSVQVVLGATLILLAALLSVRSSG